ncbi:class I SAM-dependent DNA methyltransferase [Dechloromonas denitrificans]|uniref:class I SAM-dependent DNA methyltransferase n=1 Tax=Dechloromonas denitrificans TaxID=281362 RepID=UPI001CFA98ED|nr:class I SAM-dependent methyltransferase [Dechloromonas denitrificans]UCV06661.1 methyltransferase domain-containing protein [Dechloromonas denitrificans]
MTQVFDVYARYYDLLYRDKDYASEAGFVAEQLRRHQPAGSRILELGCGTGIHAEYLARKGFHVHGVDLSAEMLVKAEARKASLPPEIAACLSFSQGDVRTVRVGAQFDAVVSLFHVMSYQNSNADLAAAFATAAQHLGPGGVFMFDYWYGPAVLLQKPEVRVKRLGDDQIEVLRIAEPVLRLAENVVDVNYSVIIKTKASCEVRQINETHSMRYLFLPEIPQLASGPEWASCTSTAWLKDVVPTEQDWAGFSVIHRR